MCDIGMRVRIGTGAQHSNGDPVKPGTLGLVVGKYGAWRMVACDGGAQVLAHATQLARMGTSVQRAVVVMPDGSASPLTRTETRLRVRARR